MHDQGLRDSRRVSGKFERVPPAEYSINELEWLRPVPGVPKLELRRTITNLDEEEWDMWRLPAPAEGIAVTYPDRGVLFIHLLSGRGLFGSLTTKDLLDAAEAEGLDGIGAEVQSPGMRAILLRLGFMVTEAGPGWTRMELRITRN